MPEEKYVKRGELAEFAASQPAAPIGTVEEAAEIPEILPLLALPEVNTFPRMIHPIVVNHQKAMAMIQDSILRGRMLALAMLKEDHQGHFEDLTLSDLHPVGVTAFILKMSQDDSGSMRVLLQGLTRMQVVELVETDPYPTARIQPIIEIMPDDQETQAMMAGVRGMYQRVLELSPGHPEELKVMNQSIDHPGLLADMIVSSLNVKRDEKHEFLAMFDVKERLKKVMFMLERQLDILELGSRIQSEIKDKIDKSHRDFYLREQIKALQDELGEREGPQVEVDDLRERLNQKALSDEIRKTAEQELTKLSRMNPASPDYTVTRNYLDWILDLPWLEYTKDSEDIVRAQKILDEDHYGLTKIKKRIIEYLAVRTLKPDMKGPILCFAGPPGTGKTSLGRSIARALGRKFIRMSLGGVRDEAEIRGHRRTYIGALPGRIIQGLKKAGSSNPVFMLDEVDKIGADYRGDPSSALLEVLDPEQNFSFSDHYLEVEYDLSKVMFIATGNYLEGIPGPLRDRMEIISLSGYTTEEKLLIARRYLAPRQREANGLAAKNIELADSAIRRIITDYTREAGVRNLEREIGSVCRAVATEVAKGRKKKTVVNAKDVADYLGPQRFENEVRMRTSQAGVATGLAWTAAGGDILFIEATAMPGKGGLTLTGQLGDVMKESAQAALSIVRSRSEKLDINPDYFSRHDIHIHIPAGAIPKDGPSAGVTLTTALFSLVTGRRIRSDLAMTGEITLRGLVLPVGGIKEKVLAAKRAGLKRVILPARNQNDFIEITESLRKGLTVHPVKTIEDVLELALEK